MSGEFDPVKAQREQVLGLADVHKVIHMRARDAEQRMAEAEADYNSLLKLEAFTKDLLAKGHKELQRLEDEQGAKST